MGRSEHGALQYLGVEVWLILPHIEGVAVVALCHCAIIHHGTARGVEYHCIGSHGLDALTAYKVVRRRVEGRMKGDDVGLPANIVERGATGGIGNAASSGAPLFHPATALKAQGVTK